VYHLRNIHFLHHVLRRTARVPHACHAVFMEKCWQKKLYVNILLQHISYNEVFRRNGFVSVGRWCPMFLTLSVSQSSGLLLCHDDRHNLWNIRHQLYNTHQSHWWRQRECEISNIDSTWTQLIAWEDSLCTATILATNHVQCSGHFIVPQILYVSRSNALNILSSLTKCLFCRSSSFFHSLVLMLASN
jgi:hypothetical protein